jgi:hypothetical protein
MSTQTYENILQEAEKLPPGQRLMLIERLIHDMRTAVSEPIDAPAWEDYAGSAPYPLCGEDAQEWISRGRQESDEARKI